MDMARPPSYHRGEVRVAERSVARGRCTEENFWVLQTRRSLC